MKKIPRRCGASLPKERADEGWYWCDQKQGHTGNHTDGVKEWRDQDTVCVVSYDNVRAVPDHIHDFVGDEDECVAEQLCRLTYGESRAQRREWEQEQADICSFCGHDNARHTFELPDEGGRDYCTECDGEDEFHSFDKEPMVYVPGKAELIAAMAKLTGPSMPRERLEAAAEGAYVLLGLADPEPVKEPQEGAEDALPTREGRTVSREVMEGVVGRLKARQGARPALAQYDEWAAVAEERAAAEEDLAVECECGTIWPDGVMGNGHNDVDCEQADPDEDICACGCTRREHRSSLNWGHSCDGCTAKGPRATYQWRHPFVLAKG